MVEVAARPRVTLHPTDSTTFIAAAVADCRALNWETDINCARCTRHLCVVDRRSDALRVPRILEDGPTLNGADFCRWCARPMTAQAELLCPLSGYVEFARLLASRRPATRVTAQ